MGKYTKEFCITFRDVDRNGRLRINALVDFMQEIAREHALVAGVDFEKAQAEYYWIIIRNKITMLRTPMIGEVVHIETYHSGLDRLYAVREFVVYDAQNQKIGTITGYYLLMERGKAKLVRIKGNPELSMFDTVHTGNVVGKLIPPKQDAEKTMQRRVHSSDIDGNGHMNNAHYVRWCFDMYETSELNESEVQSFQIQYVKELLENDEITVNRYADGYIVGKSEKSVHFIGKIDFA